jgi:AGCS family alanine or glycine:cation symporter
MNNFQPFDMEFVAGEYSDTNPEHQQNLFSHLSYSPEGDPVQSFNGVISVMDGKSMETGYTVIHNRSIAEEVSYLVGDQPFNGELQIVDGELQNSAVTVTGYSLVHSVELTTKAFTRGLFGEYGQYIVSLGLVLFAFSTAVAWSYYGDRAMTYLFGVKTVLPYRIAYVIGFFLAAVSDTSLVWLISAITVALMTIPNLIGIMMLHKEMKNTVAEYWAKFTREESS